MNTKQFTDGRSIVGIGLLAFGALLLLKTLGIFPIVGSLMAGSLFLMGGALFALVFVNNRRNWWALFPAGGLAAIGATILVDGLIPGVGGGFVFLAVLSAAFWLVYLNDRFHWWAIIPGGVLATLSVIAFLDWGLPFLDTGAIFFFGLAATFGLVLALARQLWAAIPAVVLLIIGSLIVIGSLAKFLFPLVLIGLGVALFVRNQRSY